MRARWVLVSLAAFGLGASMAVPGVVDIALADSSGFASSGCVYEYRVGPVSMVGASELRVRFRLDIPAGTVVIGRWEDTNGTTGPQRWWVGPIGQWYQYGGEADSALRVMVAPGASGSASFRLFRPADYGACWTVSDIVVDRIMYTGSGGGSPGGGMATPTPSPSGAPSPSPYPSSDPEGPYGTSSPPPGYCWGYGPPAPGQPWPIYPCEGASPTPTPAAPGCGGTRLTVVSGASVSGESVAVPAGQYAYVYKIEEAIAWAGSSDQESRLYKTDATFLWASARFPSQNPTATSTSWTYGGSPPGWWDVARPPYSGVYRYVSGDVGLDASYGGWWLNETGVSVTVQLRSSFAYGGYTQAICLVVSVTSPSVLAGGDPGGPSPSPGASATPPWAIPSIGVSVSVDVNICAANRLIPACTFRPLPSYGAPQSSAAVGAFASVVDLAKGKAPFGYVAQVADAIEAGVAGAAGAEPDWCFQMKRWDPEAGITEAPACLPLQDMANAAAFSRPVLVAILMLVGGVAVLRWVMRSTGAS